MATEQRFWQGMDKATVLGLLDKILVGMNVDGSAKYADINQIVGLISAIASTGFKGTALTTTNPGTPTVPQFWLAGASGVFTNFGNTSVDLSTGIVILSGEAGAWTKVTIPVSLSGYVTISSIVNNLTAGGTAVPLSAEQGKVLKALIDNFGTSFLPQKLTQQTSPTIVSNQYYAYNTGAALTGSGYKTALLNMSTYIGDIYLTAGYTSTAIALAVYFNASMVYLGYEYRGTGTLQNVDKLKLHPPAGAAFVGVTFQSTTMKVYTGATATDILSKEAADNLYAALSDFKALRDILPQTKTDITGATVASTYYALNTGVLASNSLFKTTFIDMTGRKGAILISATLNNTATALATYFNELGEYISQQFPGTTGTVTYADQLLTIPLGTKTIGITALTTGALIVNGGTVSSEVLTKPIADGLYSPPKQIIRQVKLKLATTDKILLYGTSISSSIYPWYAQHMTTLTGVTNVVKGGFAGIAAAGLAANTRIQSIFDAAANLIINEIGANDSGAPLSVGTFNGGIAGEPIVTPTDISVDYSGTTFIQAVDHHMRKLKAYYYNIRARANLTGNETEAEKTTKIDAVLKPHIVYLSGLPQQRTDANSVFSKPENWARKEAAIIEAGNRNGMQVILFSSICGWDMSLEPFFTGSQGTTDNLGVKTMDGLHPNKYGAYEFAMSVCGGIGII